MIWNLRSSEIDALELPADLIAFARSMAGEKAAAITDDRSHILTASASEIEQYVGRMYFRGLAGSARACASIVELDAGGDVPSIPQLPQTSPVNVTSVQRWDDAAEAFRTEPYILRPLGAIRVQRSGTYQIAASATPNTAYPIAIQEATARLFAFRETSRPQRSKMAGSVDDQSGLPTTLAGAVMKSGAGEILRFIPRRRA